LQLEVYLPLLLLHLIFHIQFVKDGDTLSEIAQDNGLSLNELLALNPQYKANPDDVKAFQPYHRHLDQE
jgi:hypothetical protein